MEPQFWAEFFKFASGMGVGGSLLAFGIWFVNKDKVAAQADLKISEKARIDLLQDQNRMCNDDRIAIRNEMHAGRIAHASEIAELRKNHDAKLEALNTRIFDIYKSRDQKVIAEKMERAAVATQVGRPVENVS